MMLSLDKVFSLFERQKQKVTFLIIGLGNYGREYRLNRHNVGFMVIDKLCQISTINLSRIQLKALVGSGDFAGNKIILAKPQTYMNLSGLAVASLVRFYKVPLENLLIIHDDLDLSLGTIRLRPTGGSAGQKGMVSIIEKLGTQDFPRLRIGIGRPPGRMEAADYVLQNFPASDQELLSLTINRATEMVKSFICDGLQQAMNQYNGTL